MCGRACGPGALFRLPCPLVLLLLRPTRLLRLLPILLPPHQHVPAAFSSSHLRIHVRHLCHCSSKVHLHCCTMHICDQLLALWGVILTITPAQAPALRIQPNLGSDGGRAGRGTKGSGFDGGGGQGGRGVSLRQGGIYKRKETSLIGKTFHVSLSLLPRLSLRTHSRTCSNHTSPCVF